MPPPGASYSAVQNVREEQLGVVRRAPLVSIDLVIEDGAGRALLGMRCNEPAQGTWFVPGGRINKDERLDDAFERILAREVGWRWRRAEAEFIGVYEHFYDTNFAREPGVGTHYVVLAHRFVAPNPPPVHPDDQHDELRWLEFAAIRNDPAVHPNSKAYFLTR